MKWRFRQHSGFGESHKQSKNNTQKKGSTSENTDITEKHFLLSFTQTNISDFAAQTLKMLKILIIIPGEIWIQIQIQIWLTPTLCLVRLFQATPRIPPQTATTQI